MKAFLLALSSIFFTHVVTAQSLVDSTETTSLRILSWNIYMLPGFLSKGKMARAEAIGSVLAKQSYDVILLQEAFCGKARRRIVHSLSDIYPFQARSLNSHWLSTRINSGLWVLSKYPIEMQTSIEFKHRKGIDALSRKGALLVEIKTGNQPLQLIVTHLQNDLAYKNQLKQCSELGELLKKHQRKGVPQIICGDFNINKFSGDQGYLHMLHMLEATDGDLETGTSFSYDRLSNDLGIEKGSEQELIDYILLKNNDSDTRIEQRKISVLKVNWHPLHKDLSDHYALESRVVSKAQPRLILTANP